MIKVVYKLPGASTSFLNSPVLKDRVKRTCALICEYESESEDSSFFLALMFEGVEAFRCTYGRACNIELIRDAYDKIVDLGETNWLREIKLNLKSYDSDTTSLSHLAVYFDDGPAFEFICRDFRTENWLGGTPNKG